MQRDGWRLAALPSAPLSPFPWRQPGNEQAVSAVRAVPFVPDQIMAQDQVQDGCIVLDVSISTGAPEEQGKALIGIFFS